MKYQFFSDPSHGWLRVPRESLRKLDIEDRVSHYSYQQGDEVYLEEDGDLSLFINSSIKAEGLEVNRETASRWMADNIKPDEIHDAYSPIHAMASYCSTAGGAA